MIRSVIGKEGGFSGREGSVYKSSGEILHIETLMSGIKPRRLALVHH